MVQVESKNWDKWHSVTKTEQKYFVHIQFVLTFPKTPNFSLFQTEISLQTTISSLMKMTGNSPKG